MSHIKVLVVGASGFVGARLCGTWDPDLYTALYHHMPIEGGVRFDVCTERLADRFLLRGHGYTHAILAHGVTKLADCANNHSLSMETNVLATIRAIDDIIDANVHPLFLSSDAVFDGTGRLRTENENPYPILSYGRQKAEIEAYLSRSSSPWTILRLSKIIASYEDLRNPLSQWMAKLMRRELIKCATDQVLTPVDVDDVVGAIRYVVDAGIVGIFNIAGPECVTRFELLQTLLGYVPEQVRMNALVRSCRLRDIPFLEPMPKDCSLSVAKFKAVSGLSFRSVDEVCLSFCDNVFATSRCLPTAEIGG